ncbi:MAG: dihydroorotate dehydrogenase [Defluviitaleaceae bacterium]|nr:dihydroorotate dehydrogenase [Defluviitaleaceae bacterium]
MKKKLNVNIAGINFENPVMTASGTFGSGKEYSEFFDLNRLGAIVCKGVSKEPWTGNEPHRIAETYGGMLNSIGLQNYGAKAFIENDLAFLNNFETKIIINLCGKTTEDYIAVAEEFANLENLRVDMFEINISCPNIKEGGIAFGTDAKIANKLIKELRKYIKKPIIAKLSPNVTDISEIAKAVEEAGSDCISLINTISAMKIDIHKRKTVLSTGSGGLSGPAIKPIAIHMVNKVFKSVKIPIIGMGGIMTGDDAIEFIMAGATAVAVGTANFTNPYATIEVLNGIENFIEKYNIKDLEEIRGIV